MLREQSVGEHCWQVATLYIEIFGTPRSEVFVYILHHDSGEQWAGDLPFGTKSQTPGLKQAMNYAEENGRSKLGIKLPDLELIEYTKIKICDLLEMWETGVHERNLGNRYADPITKDTWEQAWQLAAENGLHDKLADWRRKHHGSK